MCEFSFPFKWPLKHWCRWKGQPYVEGSNVSLATMVQGMGIDNMNLVAAQMRLTVKLRLMKQRVYVALPPIPDTSMNYSVIPSWGTPMPWQWIGEWPIVASLNPTSRILDLCMLTYFDGWVCPIYLFHKDHSAVLEPTSSSWPFLSQARSTIWINQFSQTVLSVEIYLIKKVHDLNRFCLCWAILSNSAHLRLQGCVFFNVSLHMRHHYDIIVTLIVMFKKR